jgi:hypothetical protein
MSSTLNTQPPAVQGATATSYYYYGFGVPTAAADGSVVITNMASGSNGPHGDVPIATTQTTQLVSAMASYTTASSCGATSNVVAQPQTVSMCLCASSH